MSQTATAAHYLTFLAAHAARQPEKIALRVSAGASDPDTFEEHTYAQLLAAVLALSQQLRATAPPGERALLLLPSGAEFITAFLACLHAGIIAVPAYPPRRNRNRDRVLAIHDDAQPALILTTAAAEAQVREALPDTKAQVERVAPRALSASQKALPSETRGGARVPPLHNADGIAFLQYTSGSTGAPKGTVITHANLLANLDALQGLFQHEPEHEVINWLPPFHDAGLMGLLTPFRSGMTVTLLPPEEFLRTPIRWLQVISSRRALVFSGAPNFAYHLLAERATDEEIAALDLSRWRVAFNGSEPVRAATLQRFAQRFGVCGFRAEAWLQCYGLAENTLLAAGWRKTGDPAAESGTGILRANCTALENGRFELAVDDASNARLLVSCGPPMLDTRITIHDAETGIPLPEARIGEIHIHSPSVSRGYWRNEAATAAAFPQAGSLRTGDLGFLHDGELFVTGRVKDLIIIRGRNLHPHDIENCVAAHLPAATGANSIAAFEFSGNGSGSGALGLLIEAPRTWVSALKVERAAPRALAADAPEGNARGATRSTDELLARIRQAVAETFEVTADLIAFVAPGDFPRTSSGKVQRSACRDGVMNGTLPVIHRNQLTAAAPSRSGGMIPPPQTQPRSGKNAALGSAADAVEMTAVENRRSLDSRATADTLIQWLRTFASRRLNSQLMDERRTVAPHVVLEFGNHGLFGLEVPRELGGLGLTTSDSYRVMEQLAAIDLTLALVVGNHNALGLHPILRHGLPALREELIPAMAGGRHLASFAITELTAGSHPKSIETMAMRGSDGRWTIHGRKQWIGLASWAGTVVVIAKAQTESGEHLGSVTLAVSADAEGVSFGPEAMTMGMRGTVQVPVFFDGVQVDAARVLGEVGRGFDVAYDAMRLARVGLAALSLGAMKRCLQWMTTYATDRDVAGGRLADLPATQSRLAETVNAIAAVESLVRAVGDWLDAGAAMPEEVFLICKTTAPELLGETADRAMQMLGARGYMENNGLPQLFRDARLLRIFEGPTEALNASLGARLRRGSDALCAWMEQRDTDIPVCEERPDTDRNVCVTLRALAAEHPAVNDVALGELASLHFLRWIVRRSPQAGAGEATAWLEERLRQRSAVAGAVTGTVVVGDIAARLKQEIGAFEQSLPGEDRELDALLRLTSRSGGLIPPTHTQPRSGKNATSPSAADAVEMTAVENRRSLDSRATVETLERGLLDFLRREKLGNMESVPHDATFSSLGIDSLAAASLATEIEKVFGVKIRDETLYDYPTLERLAGYIESRRAPEGTPAEQGRAIWQMALGAMNERINRVKEAGRYVYLIPFEAQDGASVVIEGRRCVLLSSYSYLGLMDAPEIWEAMQSRVETCGASSHGSRMLANGMWHKELEARIAEALQSEAAVTFGNGFSTNWTVISTLMSAEDTIIADEWIHASLVDGCKGSGATFTYFRHSNLEHLAELLKVPSKGKTLVVIDAVYSMEGDIAPVPEISALAHAHGAWLMVDEAHSLGVLGARGLGVQEHFGLAPDAIDIKMGTLSKAIPSAGGYIAGTADLIAALRHNVRPFIFSGAPTPPMVAAAMAGFEILLSQPERVRKLHANIRFFRDGLRRIGLTPPDTGTAIIPLMCRDEDSAFTFAKRCLADGLYVTPIVFPAVPQNAPRIRTSITAALSEEDITFALGVIAKHTPGLLVGI